MPRSREEYLATVLHDKLAASGKPYSHHLLPDQVAQTSRIRVVCPDHGEWSPLAFAYQKSGCRFCGAIRGAAKRPEIPNSRKLSLDEFRQRAAALHPHIDVSRVTEFRGAKSVLNVSCRNHDLDYEVSAFQFLWHPSDGCPKCKQERLEARSEVFRFDEGRESCEASAVLLGYSLESYTSSHDPITCNCPDHGTFTVAKAYYLTQLQAGCPRCRKGRSVVERILRKKLEALGLTVEPNRRDLLGDGQEIDLWIPRLKVGIELNGMYFHGIHSGNLVHEVKNEHRHRDKADLAEKRQVRLLQVDASVVAQGKSNLVISMACAKGNLFVAKVGARECQVRVISSPLANRFLTRNHLQGYIAATTHLGLVYRGRLLAVASFGAPRFTKNADWELLRFATLAYHQVVGGLGKILSHAGDVGIEGILVSYADRMYSTGDAYKAAAFDFVACTPPGYKYVKGKVQLSRYQCQKSKLSRLLGEGFDQSLSERDNMLKAGFIQLFDAGQLTFTKRLRPANPKPRGLERFARPPSIENPDVFLPVLKRRVKEEEYA